MFYAAIAPLLPTLAQRAAPVEAVGGLDDRGLPDRDADRLASRVEYSASRAGPKFTVFTGLALLASSTLAFGFVQTAAGLDVARFVEGIGGACSWAGGLAWIVAEAPPHRRGELIGGALGAAIGGALFGPVIGTIASAVGRGRGVQRGRGVRRHPDRPGPPSALASHRLRAGTSPSLQGAARTAASSSECGW